MLVNARSAHRWAFHCACCGADAPGKFKRKERRWIKRRERQAWKKEFVA